MPGSPQHRSVWLSLPFMTPEQAEVVIHVFEVLVGELWQVYADDINELHAQRELDEEARTSEAHPTDDQPPPSS